MFLEFLTAGLSQCLRALWSGIGKPSAVLEKITWRKAVFVAALLIAAIAFAQIVSVDFAFFLAGDIAFYCEIAAAVMFVVVQGHIRQSVQTARRRLNHAARRARAWRRRGLSARRRRDAKPHAARDKGADEDGGWLPQFGLACGVG